MIVIKVNCETNEKMIRKRDEFHKSLIGTPAYKSSEIAICDEDETSFLLVIGNNNKHNSYYKINSNRLTKYKKEK